MHFDQKKKKKKTGAGAKKLAPAQHGKNCLFQSWNHWRPWLWRGYDETFAPTRWLEHNHLLWMLFAVIGCGKCRYYLPTQTVRHDFGLQWNLLSSHKCFLSISDNHRFQTKRTLILFCLQFQFWLSKKGGKKNPHFAFTFCISDFWHENGMTKFTWTLNVLLIIS